MTGGLANLNLVDLVWILGRLVVVVLSIMVHELVHAVVAYAFGDTTAKDAGRITVNPLKHLDPFGSVILPLFLAMSNAPVFAYAKPVPYNPHNLRNRNVAELCVAFAGPASNGLLAMLGAGIMWLAYLLDPSSYAIQYDLRYWLFMIGYTICTVNLVLLFFNIIPLPPLDGSAIIGALLPERHKHLYYQVKKYSMLILLVVLFVLPMVLNWSPLGAYLSGASRWVLGWAMPPFYYYAV